MSEEPIRLVPFGMKLLRLIAKAVGAAKAWPLLSCNCTVTGFEV